MVGVKHASKSDGDNVDATLWNTAHSITGVARAYQSAGTQSVVTGTDTKVTLEAESYDPDSVYDTTNYRYAPATAGYYLTIGSVEYSDLADGDVYSAKLWKTGAEYTASKYTVGAAKSVTAVVMDIVYLGATDYIELYTFHDKGANATTVNSSDTTFLSVTPLSV